LCAACIWRSKERISQINVEILSQFEHGFRREKETMTAGSVASAKRRRRRRRQHDREGGTGLTNCRRSGTPRSAKRRAVKINAASSPRRNYRRQAGNLRPVRFPRIAVLLGLMRLRRDQALWRTHLASIHPSVVSIIPARRCPITAVEIEKYPTSAAMT